MELDEDKNHQVILYTSSRKDFCIII